MELYEYYRNRRVLVTGGTGFVGSHLIKKLIDMDCIVLYTGSSNDRRQINDSNCSFRCIDISDNKSVDSLISEFNPEIIFHLAAIVTANRDLELIEDMIKVNLIGTINILKAINKCSKLECMINFGTVEEYGINDEDMVEGCREEPKSPYAILKMATTKFCNLFSSIYNIPIITVRPSIIFGEGQHEDKFIPYVINKCLKNEEIKMTYGEQKRNFIYISDFIDAILMLACKERNKAQVYNIGGEETISLKEAVLQIKSLLNSISDIKLGAIEYRSDEMMASNMNIEKIKRLGWKPKYSFSEGLKKTIEYYMNRR